MDCYLNSIGGCNKNILLLCSLLQCLHIKIIYSGVVSKNQQRATYAASSKMIKLFNPPMTASLCSGVRGYFVSQYIINMEHSIKHHIM